MKISLEEAKQYLRVDFDDDDFYIHMLLVSAEQTCMAILRTNDPDVLKSEPNVKIAMLYCVSYLYENRETANHSELNHNLRALLFSGRREIY